MTEITLIMGVYDEEERYARVSLSKAKAFVDEIILIEDGSLSQQFKDWAKVLNCEIYYRQWIDDWAVMRNSMLDLVLGGWILALDPDEILSVNALKSLRKYIEGSDDGGLYNVVSFKCIDILEKENGTHELLEVEQHWWKEIFYKYYPWLQWKDGPVHASLAGRLKAIKADEKLTFNHIKTPEKWAKMYCHYFWTAGEKVHERLLAWKLFREICHEYKIYTWNDLHSKMKEGTIPLKLHDMFINWRNDTYCVERRSFYTYYFVHLHPELNPEGISQEKGQLISVGDEIVQLPKL